MQKMFEFQETIKYPKRKVCDIEITPDYSTGTALLKYMKKHMLDFFESVEVENGLVLTGKKALKEGLAPNNGGEYLTLMLKLNRNKKGIPVNYSLYLMTEKSKEKK